MSAEPPTATIRVMRLAGHERSRLQTAEAAFRRDHPDYAATAVIDALRRTEFARLDSTGHVYLDTPQAASTATRSCASTCGYRFTEFAHMFVDLTAMPADLPARPAC